MLRVNRLWLACLAFAPALIGSSAATGLGIEVLSSKPQLVTGGDALVAIRGSVAAPTVTVGGADQSKAFTADPKNSADWIGLLTGLADGDNVVTARAGADQASLTLKNHAINATLFAGPQQTPFLCELGDNGLKAAPGARLDPADRPDCAAVTTVTYYYRNKAGTWKPFDEKARPNDIGTTKTSDGKDVPLIIRQEKGVINRAAYVISILHDPAAGPAPSPTSRGGSGWNGKLMWSFGGAVQANYHMGRKLGDMSADFQYVEDTTLGFKDAFITRGYAIAAASLSVFGTNNDDVKSAETLAKVKERFIELYGPPIFTVATGVSGGSMQQHLIANAYPGLLDGLLPGRSFIDTITFLQPLYDCELLTRVFRGGSWTRAQLDAVSGKYWGYCVSNGTRYPNARPDFCDLAVLDMIDNTPAVKAKGVRCTYQDNLANIFGTDPKTGFARNPFDNVGVQYGLKALNDGVISWAQFLDINTRIGGHDVNGRIVAQRQAGDDLAIKRAYETGRVVSGTGGMADIPMISVRSYNDQDPLKRGDPNVDVHDGYHSQIVEDRLKAYNGTAANYVQFMTATFGYPQIDAQTVGGPLNSANVDALEALDKWITAIQADRSTRSPAQKTAANRPADLVNTCYPARGGAVMQEFERVTNWERCKQMFPTFSDARLVAGAPATDDVLKCALKPIDAKDYKSAPNADQLVQLQKIFPDGVCDYAKPGIGQTAKVVTWAKFNGDGAYEQVR
ncbi:MAG: DUF6351 family protein [Bauldia sp.]